MSACLDIDCHPWLDWWFGGLHYHAVHHLFPRMCRKYYREATEEVRSMCHAHGVAADHVSFYAAIEATLKKLRRVGLYALAKEMRDM